MCNAWNHSAHCTCGWGGSGYKGRKANTQSGVLGLWPPNIPPILATVTSFTIPNATCPVCSKPVFYYCNNSGSSVFFDELGPPWPKHPCTDNCNRNRPEPLLLVTDSVDCLSQAEWQRNGWSLFKIVGAREIDRKTYQLKLFSSETMRRLSMYLFHKSIIDGAGAVYVFPDDPVAFVKKIKDGKYRVSALVKSLNSIEFDAYDSRTGLNESLRSKGVGLHGGRYLKARRGR